MCVFYNNNKTTTQIQNPTFKTAPSTNLVQFKIHQQLIKMFNDYIHQVWMLQHDVIVRAGGDEGRATTRVFSARHVVYAVADKPHGVLLT